MQLPRAGIRSEILAGTGARAGDWPETTRPTSQSYKFRGGPVVRASPQYCEIVLSGAQPGDPHRLLLPARGGEKEPLKK